MAEAFLLGEEVELTEAATLAANAAEATTLETSFSDNPFNIRETSFFGGDDDPYSTYSADNSLATYDANAYFSSASTIGEEKIQSNDALARASSQFSSGLDMINEEDPYLLTQRRSNALNREKKRIHINEKTPEMLPHRTRSGRINRTIGTVPELFKLEELSGQQQIEQQREQILQKN